MLLDYLAAGFFRATRTIRYAPEDRVEDRLPEMGIPTPVVRGSRDPTAPQRWAEAATGLLPAAGSSCSRGQLTRPTTARPRSSRGWSGRPSTATARRRDESLQVRREGVYGWGETSNEAMGDSPGKIPVNRSLPDLNPCFTRP
jgi:hypothetical protein